MSRDERLDDWEVCQLMISEAILEIQGAEQDKIYEPWGGIFSVKPKRVIYGVHQLIDESEPGKSN